MISQDNLITEYERIKLRDEGVAPSMYHEPQACKTPAVVKDKLQNMAWCERERQDLARPRLVFTHVNGKLGHDSL